MNKRSQLICLWAAPLMGVMVTIGWWLLAKFVPPPLPSSGAAEIAELFRQNTNGIRVGMILLVAGAGLFAPFIAVISAQIQRIEGSPPVLAYTQLLGGAMSIAIILIPAMLWTTAAFRPERNPELILLLNDASWLIIAMTFSPAVIQNVAIGLAILGDKNQPPIFPRWVGYLNFWVAFLLLPAGLMTFFKTGPFAWNGLLAFWMPLVVFAIWFNVMFITLLKAIKRQPDVGVLR
ncbi:MAG: hypothetical protein JWM78_2447 [Verrucomicrobiaceae bacterium]|nr:hypothetical protein [Verrucomicrobiaceae bacterium]